ncbi:hypothetical protein BKA82DRAFT_4018662 [Pisolithus tinctorius]|nr:hypothetical protein BKA82DRAFT_4018662 [Pisolithus tinctorius]
MLEWCAWKATLQQVLGIPHLLNADGQMAGNSLINTKYIQGAACKIWVTQISSDSSWNDGCMAGNSLINGTYIPGAACEVPLVRSGSLKSDLIHAGMVSMESHCWGVLGMLHPLNVDGQMAGNSLINTKYTKGVACEIWCPWKAAVQQVPGIPHLLNTDGQKAGNNLINGTYILGVACELQFMPEWCPWKATVEGVPGMPHLLNVDGQMAGNSLINAKYTKGAAYGWKAGNSLINGTYIPGAACEVWVTQISSNSCQNGVHGKPLLSGCWGCCIHSIKMGGWLAIV